MPRRRRRRLDWKQETVKWEENPYSEVNKAYRGYEKGALDWAARFYTASYNPSGAWITPNVAITE
jgi:hypothetical protein